MSKVVTPRAESIESGRLPPAPRPRDVTRFTAAGIRGRLLPGAELAVSDAVEQLDYIAREIHEGRHGAGVVVQSAAEAKQLQLELVTRLHHLCRLIFSRNVFVKS